MTSEAKGRFVSCSLKTKLLGPGGYWSINAIVENSGAAGTLEVQASAPGLGSFASAGKLFMLPRKRRSFTCWLAAPKGSQPGRYAIEVQLTHDRTVDDKRTLEGEIKRSV